MRIRLLDLLVAAFWVFLIVDAYAQGRELPVLVSELNLPEISVVLAVCLVLAVALAFGSLAFWQRKNIMDEMPGLSGTVDRVFGEGAYGHFTRRLRPVWASIVSSLVLGAVGLHANVEMTGNSWSYVVCVGFFAFALFMFGAFLVSRRYPPTLR
jgi:hypothetical protein